MIHSTAIVHEGAELDAGVEVGPYCVIGPHVKIGKGTRLQSHVVIEGRTRIGEDCTFFSFGAIGNIPQDLKYKGEPTELLIGSKNIFRELVTVSVGTVQGGGVTSIGNENLIMSAVHLGHDCIIGNNCIISSNSGLAGHVTMEDCSYVSGMCGVAQFVRIGKYSYVAGQSSVDRDVPPFSVSYGARPVVVKGCNLVGLKRRGFSNSQLQKVSESMKIWTDSSIPKEAAIDKIEAEYGDVEEVRYLISFIRSSKTGVAR